MYTVDKIINTISEVKRPNRTNIIDKAIANFEEAFVGTATELKNNQKLWREQGLQEYYKAMDNYRDTINNLEEQLRDAVCANYDISPAAFKIIWDKAYEDNHAEGYAAIIDGVDTLVAFVKDINAANAK